MESGLSFDDVDTPEPEDVPNEVAVLGSSVDLLVGSVHRGQVASAFCTTAHPVFYPGIVVYCETNGACREQHAALGWSFSDDDNIPRVVSPDKQVVITAVGGNARTGVRGLPYAQTNRPRRQAGMRIIRRNAAQLSFLEMFTDDEVMPDGAEEVQFGPTWFLLYHRIGDIVRSELSLAKGINESGANLVWARRLILPVIDLLNDPPVRAERDGDIGPIIDVPVERRAG